MAVQKPVCIISAPKEQSRMSDRLKAIINDEQHWRMVLIGTPCPPPQSVKGKGKMFISIQYSQHEHAFFSSPGEKMKRKEKK